MPRSGRASAAPAHTGHAAATQPDHRREGQSAGAPLQSWLQAVPWCRESHTGRVAAIRKRESARGPEGKVRTLHSHARRAAPPRAPQSATAWLQRLRQQPLVATQTAYGGPMPRGVRAVSSGSLQDPARPARAPGTPPLPRPVRAVPCAASPPPPADPRSPCRAPIRIDAGAWDSQDRNLEIPVI